MTDSRAIPTATEVDRILLAYPIPAAITGTKQARGDAEWCTGDRRSLLHPHWMLRTADGAKQRHNIDFYVGFDAPVDFGGVLLSSPGLTHDVLTKKLVLLAMLNGTAGNSTEAEAVRRVALSMDWFTRWRLNSGISCNTDLRRDDFERFKVAMKAPHVVRLVSIDERVTRLLAMIEAGEPWPGQSPGGTDAAGSTIHETLDFDAVAAQLGVTAESLHSAGAVLDRLVAAHGGGSGTDQGTSAPPGIEMRPRRDALARSAWSIDQLLKPWRIMQDLSVRGVLAHDPLRFDPFAETTVAVVAAAHGAQFTRTGGISPPYFFSILAACATWVLDYSGPLLRAVALMRDDSRLHGYYPSGNQCGRRLEMSMALDSELPVDMPRLWLAWLPPVDPSDVRTAGRISLMVAVSHLMTACLLLVAGLAARTIKEVLALKAGCILRPAPGLFELSIQVDGRLRELDCMPVPAIVAHAVEVLEKLTAGTREKTGEDWLFRYRRDYVRRPDEAAQTLPYLGFPKPKYIPRFLAINGLRALDPSTSAWLVGSDMRKGFAVSYHYVVPGASEDALTRFFGGWDPARMRAYVHGRLPGRISELQDQIRARRRVHGASTGEADAAWLREAETMLADLRRRAQAFDEVRCEAFVERMLRIVDGVDLPAGKGGARLVGEAGDMVAGAQARARLGASNHPDAERQALWAILHGSAATHALEHVPGGHTHCTCRANNEEDLAAAVCLRRRAADPVAAMPGLSPTSPDGMADHAYSGLVPCARCEHGAAFADDRAVGRAMCGRVADAAARAPSADARAASEALLEEIRACIPIAGPVSERGP